MGSREWSPGLALAAALALLPVLACGQPADEAAGVAAPTPPASESPVVARLNGEPITIADLQGGYPRALRPERTHAIDNAVQRRLTAREARRRGLDATSAVRAQIEALRRQAGAREEVLLREALRASLEAQVALTEAELRAHYDQTQVRYTRRRVLLRQAVFDSAEAARAEDQRLGADGRLDPAASEEIGPVSIGELTQSRLPGVMSLRQPGERIVVEREGSFALVELVEELPQAPLPFEEVRDQVESELRSQQGSQALAKLVEELVAAARIEIDEAVLQNDAEWQQSYQDAAPLRRPWR